MTKFKPCAILKTILASCSVHKKPDKCTQYKWLNYFITYDLAALESDAQAKHESRKCVTKWKATQAIRR